MTCEGSDMQETREAMCEEETCKGLGKRRVRGETHEGRDMQGKRYVGDKPCLTGN